MSGIPPPSLGSVLQSGMAQEEQSRKVDAEKNARQDAAQKLRGGPDAVLEIEETDADTHIQPDGEGYGGGGGQGTKPEEEEKAEENTTGVSVDENGQQHIDYSA